MKNIVKVNELRRNITIELHNQVTELDSLSLVLKNGSFQTNPSFSNLHTKSTKQSNNPMPKKKKLETPEKVIHNEPYRSNDSQMWKCETAGNKSPTF